jgi:G:T-mismatch repair DNA endonuclease (very short patch repair protein)
MSKCEICEKEFLAKNEKRPARTCSKECKNKLARQITTQQFRDPAAREVQRQKSLAQKTDPEYQQKLKHAIEKRTKRWKQQGHPRIGMKHPESAKEKIGHANRGRFKGKTWEEIFGKEVAQRRRIENSISMSKQNEVLLSEKRSGLEEKILPYLKGYANNVQISYYNVDFLNKETKHIIEIHGDYWHCNPVIYPDEYVHTILKMTAKQKREADEHRKQILESMGYSVTVVWESELDEFIKTLT